MSYHFNQLPAGSDQGKIAEQPKSKKPQPPQEAGAVDHIEPPKSPLKKKEK